VVLALIALVGFAFGARAQDLARESVPQKWIEPLLPEDLPPLDYPKYFNDLDKARLQVQTGRYKLALQTLAHVKGDATDIAVLKATAMNAIGKKQPAVDLLSVDTIPKASPAQVLRARILSEMGKNDAAMALLNEHLKANPNSIPGHYYSGFVAEQLGKLNDAKNFYNWFLDDKRDYLAKLKQDRPDRALQSAENVTLIGRAIDRWATLNGAYQKNENLHQAILNIFVKAYDEIDRSYAPAHVAAAEYFLSHDNSTEATKELQAALRTNESDLDAADLLGRIAIQNFDFDTADQVIAAIRHVDRGSPRADILEARNFLHQRRPVDAFKPINRLLQQQPQNIEALGLLAATYALRLEDDKAAAVLKQVDSIDPDNATAYFEMAEQLGAMRQYPRSAAMYKIAIQRAPWWTAARNDLGLLYTQSGDEDEARTTLDAAHALDPFNLATTNYLRLLDELSGFARKETAHFIVMYDAKLDPMIPEYFSDYLESVQAQVCAEYKCEPKVKTYIEVFPTHDAFSVRTTGSPWIGTVGASTGRVIALVSPRRGTATMGTFNWSQVLRHEFTHTVTLAATDNRIPHWFTEGLAVYQEHSPLRWEWVPMLYNAVKKHELFTMDNLTWGFVRPKTPNDRQMAYAQSFWICTYIEEKYGHDAILAMLDQFKNGASEAEAFQRVLKVSISQFTSDFFAWTEKQVSTWGYDPETSKKYAELRDQGELMIKEKKYPEAVKLFEQIVAMRPVDQLPHQRLAGLYLTKQVNQPEKAIEHLIRLHKVDLKDNQYAKRIARIYRDEGKLEDAENYGMQAVYVDPYDLAAHKLLAELYEKAGNQAGLEREDRVIPVLEKWLEENRRPQQ
jgi:tetratricopeptide (TPR) repeat protein